MQEVVAKLNEQFKNEERVRKIHLLHEEWSVASGELTPTLKLKRPFILEKYNKEIEGMYE